MRFHGGKVETMGGQCCFLPSERNPASRNQTGMRVENCVITACIVVFSYVSDLNHVLSKFILMQLTG